MFSVTEVVTQRGTLQFRKEHYTGFRCRISPDRLKRQIDRSPLVFPGAGDCPFCPDQVLQVTPTFADGSRIVRGESVTFPNLFPFGEDHVVTTITRDHFTDVFTRRQLVDALEGITEALLKGEGYATINWNFLPSAGASLVHPHMQGLSDLYPTFVVSRYLAATTEHDARHGRNYWDAVIEAERASDRYLFGDEIVWSAHPVPLGEREVRGILPIATLDEFEEYIDLLARGILEILVLYRDLGTHAFNLSLWFDRPGRTSVFRASCSMISRINPNPSSTSDSAFMERMHLEPVILTLPEELGRYYRKEKR
jgi:galactose-1-phosphate uridylyltransferase